ncbi:MAG: AAA family ATPase [Deltaproteobacteria bacterium]|nr:AAA family ATPase [Deltaproteobacteria bacterium]
MPDEPREIATIPVKGMEEAALKTADLPAGHLAPQADRARARSILDRLPGLRFHAAAFTVLGLLLLGVWISIGDLFGQSPSAAYAALAGREPIRAGLPDSRAVDSVVKRLPDKHWASPANVSRLIEHGLRGDAAARIVAPELDDVYEQAKREILFGKMPAPGRAAYWHAIALEAHERIKDLRAARQEIDRRRTDKEQLRGLSSDVAEALEQAALKKSRALSEIEARLGALEDIRDLLSREARDTAARRDATDKSDVFSGISAAFSVTYQNVDFSGCLESAPPLAYVEITVNNKGAVTVKPDKAQTPFGMCVQWLLRHKLHLSGLVYVFEESHNAYLNIDKKGKAYLSRTSSSTTAAGGCETRQIQKTATMVAALAKVDEDERDAIRDEIEALEARIDEMRGESQNRISAEEVVEGVVDALVGTLTRLMRQFLANAVLDTGNIQTLGKIQELARLEPADATPLEPLLRARVRLVQAGRACVLLFLVGFFLEAILLGRGAAREAAHWRRLQRTFQTPLDFGTILSMLRDEAGGRSRFDEAIMYATVSGRADLLLLIETFHEIHAADQVEPPQLDSLLNLPKDVVALCADLNTAMPVFSFLRQALGVRSMSRVAGISGEIDRLKNDPGYRTFGERWFPYLDALLANLSATADNVAKHQRTANAATGAAFLNAAAGSLNETAEAVHRTTIGFERRAFLRVIAGWNGVIQRALEDLQGIAQLEASFPALTLPFARTVVLEVEVHNHGQGFAESITCALVSDELQPDEAQAPLGALLPGSTVKMHFRLHPPGIGSYAVAVSLTFDDIRRKRETVEFVETLTVREGPERPFVRMPRNPYIVGAPVRDRSMFFGREAVLDQLVEALDAGAQTNAIIIYGQRRMGKTSLLYQLQGRLDPARFTAVLMDAQGMQPPTTDRFYHLMLSCAASAAIERGVAFKLPDLSEFAAHPDEAFERHFRKLKQAAEAAGWGNRRIVLMIDEFEYLQSLIRSGTVGAGVLAYVRHLVQHEPALAFVFAGSHAIEELAAQYWSDLYGLGVHFRIGFLSEAETRELLMRPTKDWFDFDNASLDRVYDLTRGQPFLTQALASRVVSFRNRQALTRVTRDHIDQVSKDFLARGPAEVRTYWEESPQLQRMCLAGVAALVRQRGRCAYGDLRQLLGEYRISTGELPAALETLTRRELLLSDEQQGLSISMAILSEWIHRNQSLERLVG